MSRPQGYNPPVYFWIAHYSNGQALPQYDPESGRQNRFSEIDQQLLVKFGYYPFTPILQKTIKDLEVIANPLLPKHEITIQKGQRLIAYCEQGIHVSKVRICKNCGALWQQRQKPSEAKLPISFAWNGKNAVCPKCQSHNLDACPDCNANKEKYGLCENCGGPVADEACLKCKSRQPRPYMHQIFCCPKCFKEISDVVELSSIETRSTIYVLGIQETVRGSNRKWLTRIDQSGNAETLIR